MELKLPTPLSIINQSCAEHEGQWLKSIRIHPDDYDRLRKELIEVGFEVYNDMRSRLYGVPVVKDESCVEGPICEWDQWPSTYFGGRFG